MCDGSDGATRIVEVRHAPYEKAQQLTTPAQGTAAASIEQHHIHKNSTYSPRKTALADVMVQMPRPMHAADTIPIVSEAWQAPYL